MRRIINRNLRTYDDYYPKQYNIMDMGKCFEILDKVKNDFTSRDVDNRITNVWYMLSQNRFNDDNCALLLYGPYDSAYEYKREYKRRVEWIVEPGAKLNGVEFNYAYGIIHTIYAPRIRLLLTDKIAIGPIASFKWIKPFLGFRLIESLTISRGCLIV